MSKKHIKNKNSKPLYIAFASIVWLIIYSLFATVADFREQIIGSGLLGPNCNSCESQTAYSVFFAVILPLSFGAIGAGYAAGKSLTHEKQALRYGVGITVAIAVFIFSYYSFGITNFLVNFPR